MGLIQAPIDLHSFLSWRLPPRVPVADANDTALPLPDLVRSCAAVELKSSFLRGDTLLRQLPPALYLVEASVRLMSGPPNLGPGSWRGSSGLAQATRGPRGSRIGECDR